MDMKINQKNNEIKIKDLKDIDNKWVFNVLDYIYYNNVINDNFSDFFDDLFSEINESDKKKNNNNSYDNPILQKIYELLKDFVKNKPDIENEINEFKKELEEKVK